MQDSEKNKIDEIFRNALKDLPEESSTVVGWNNLKQQMVNEGFKLTTINKFNKVLQISIASALLLTTGIVAYLMINKTDVKTNNDSLNKIGQEVSTKKNDKIELNELSSCIDNFNNTINFNNNSNVLDREFTCAKTKNNFNTNFTQKNTTSNKKNTVSAISIEDNKQNNTDADNAKFELEASTTEELTNSNTNDNNITCVDSVATIPDTLCKTDATRTVILVDTSYKKYAFGIYVSLDKNSYAIQQVNNNLFGGTADYGDAIKGRVLGAEYSIGLAGGYKTSKRVLIETGLFYSQKKKIDYVSKTYRTLTSLDDTSAWSDNKFSYHYKAQYIQLFLKMKLYFLDKEKFRLFVAPGFIFDTNLPVSQKNNSYYQFESKTANKYTKQKYTFETGSIGTNLTISSGIELKLQNDFLISFEPHYIYGLNQLVKYKNIESVLPVKHYNRSIGMGVRFIKEF